METEDLPDLGKIYSSMGWEGRGESQGKHMLLQLIWAAGAQSKKMQEGKNVSLSPEMNEGPERRTDHQKCLFQVKTKRVEQMLPHSNFKLCQSVELLQNFTGPHNRRSIFKFYSDSTNLCIDTVKICRWLQVQNQEAGGKKC